MKLESLENFEKLNKETLQVVQGGFYSPISELHDPEISKKVDHDPKCF